MSSCHRHTCRTLAVFAIIAALAPATARLARAADAAAEASGDHYRQLAQQVTIYRDKYGMPHIDGETDEAVLFGFGYCQAEDYFWQLEDSLAMGLGRYAEMYGKQFLDKDMRNRAFEIPQRAQEDFPKLDPQTRKLGSAFVGGMNYYLETHPKVKPRMFKRFEGWMVLAFARGAMLELCGGHMHVGGGPTPSSYGESKINEEVKAATGSNEWAISGSRTRSGKAMLLINPHQPYYGFGQFYEAHMRSGEGWNFTGASFFATPMPALGHNEYCGWAFTTNEPGNGSSWREVFDDPNEPLNYRYDNGYRKAVQWKDTIKVRRNATDFDTVDCTFRKTHHGPILRKINDKEYVSGMIARLYDALLSRQSLKSVRAKNFAEFKESMSMLDLPLFNTAYADVHGNIFYLYNGIIPKRDPNFDWSNPVDGSDKRTEWQGIHPITDLPQVLNPPSGFVQNCNSTPYTTTDEGNPAIGDYPAYMVEDRYDDKRRAKVSRQILRDTKDLTFERLQELAFDTTIYWAQNELPRYKGELARLRETDADLAAKVEPYLNHLLEWDCKGNILSTPTTLCIAWYEELYGFGYPAETLKQQFVSNPAEQLKALTTAAKKLETTFGSWKVPYGEANRLQRHADVSDFIKIPYDDAKPSLPSAGLPGPPGVVFTMYFTPSIKVPLLKNMNKHYAVVGTSYLCAVEFGEKVKSKSLVPYGQSGDPKSPHFFDQAELLSERKMKDNLFYWDDVVAGCKRVYHPGEQSVSSAAAALIWWYSAASIARARRTCDRSCLARRPTTAAMKLGLINSAWVQSGQPTEFGLRKTREIGFDVVDIFTDPLDLDPRERRLVKDACHALGLPIVSLPCVAVGLIDLNPSVRAFHLRRAREFLDLAYDYQAENVLLVIGEYIWNREVIPPADQWAWAVEGVRSLGAHARELGLKIMIELEPFPLSLVRDIDTMVRFLDDVDAPEAQANIDVSHLALSKVRPEELRRLKGRTGHVHISDCDGQAHGDLPPGRGVVNFGPYLQEIRDLAIDGAISIELEYSPEPERIVEWVTEAYQATARLMAEHGLRG